LALVEWHDTNRLLIIQPSAENLADVSALMYKAEERRGVTDLSYGEVVGHRPGVGNTELFVRMHWMATRACE
jgi:hypothetical protein